MYRAIILFLVTMALITIGPANLYGVEPVKIMPLGDSTTQSEWCADLVSLLNRKDKAVTSKLGDPSSEEFEGTVGIVEEQRLGLAPAVLQGVRIGRHASFDRVVFEFRDNAVPGYHLEYIDRPVRQCGSGEVVEVAGDGWLLVRLIPAQAHDDSGEATVEDRERHLDLPILKELKLICDFEAEVEWVLGVSSPNRYRVLELSEPARLVVDIKH